MRLAFLLLVASTGMPIVASDYITFSSYVGTGSSSCSGTALAQGATGGEKVPGFLLSAPSHTCSPPSFSRRDRLGGCVAFTNSSGAFSVKTVCNSAHSYTLSFFSGATCTGSPIATNSTTLAAGCNNKQTQSCVGGSFPAPPSDRYNEYLYIGGSCGGNALFGWASENRESSTGWATQYEKRCFAS